ncbi:hypothetical protein M407DRAFT_12452 [Tulasnella calospora MUT 4182]|uniref:Alpha-type protein kinase domain-containing protein n=1 Tax=Tulasnella calospora MUT 4182 TaxID=1051891 RepID=A0A0C3L6K9_9AGAM|nr:hypothetical protein M407DRAFT_12452 [Tulasnella calospora MUT 4182]
MELHVFLDKYEQRTGTGEVAPTTRKSKRSRHPKDSDEDDEDEPVMKKRSTSGSGPLVSKFVREGGVSGRGVTKAADATRAIQFRRVMARIEDAETGEVSIIKSYRNEEGAISASPIKLPKGDKGRSKELYESATYVAKKLVCRAPGVPVPDIDEQYNLLLSDLVRLCKGQMFVKRFEVAAEEYAVEPSAFRFTEGFLITVFSAERSTAEAPAESALVPHGSSDGEETEELEEVYLVEPRRSTTRVEKYTGTMDNQQWLNLKSATINAFAHFVVADSACEYLLADLQALQDIREGTVLIDPMSHTPLGNSGLGDHGLTGIRSFIRTHSCSPICKDLQLASSSDLRRALDRIVNELDQEEDQSFE